MPRKPAKPTATGRGKTKAISDQTYDLWKDIVYQLYFKMNYSRSTMLDLFSGVLTENILKEVANRIRYENPDDEYCMMKTQCYRGDPIDNILRFKEYMRTLNNDTKK